MNDKRLWIVGGVLFIIAAVASLIGGSVGVAIALLVVGILFLAMPRYLARNNRS
ncbi:hypothetical protein [Rhodococcus sp. 077-4]|uniref:hypothetical protein n=1 Tax=Rhodococcus sp. 077-4 TaxID=2789271 RepID=UPI0039F4B183